LENLCLHKSRISGCHSFRFRRSSCSFIYPSFITYNLYDFGFDNYEIRKIPPTNLSLPVISGKKDTINLKSSELSIFISKNANIITKVEIPRWIFAPVHEGEKIGNVVYYLNGKKVASSPIIATEAIEQVQPKFNFFDWLFNILKGLTKWNK
jgi:hypothetical protein